MNAADVATLTDSIIAALSPSTTVLDALDRFGIAAHVTCRDGDLDERVYAMHRVPRLPRLAPRAYFSVLPSLAPGASMERLSELALWVIAAERLRALPGWTLDHERDRRLAQQIAEAVIARRGPLAPIRTDERGRWAGLVRAAMADMRDWRESDGRVTPAQHRDVDELDDRARLDAAGVRLLTSGDVARGTVLTGCRIAAEIPLAPDDVVVVVHVQLADKNHKRHSRALIVALSGRRVVSVTIRSVALVRVIEALVEVHHATRRDKRQRGVPVGVDTRRFVSVPHALLELAAAHSLPLDEVLDVAALAVARLDRAALEQLLADAARGT